MDNRQRALWHRSVVIGLFLLFGVAAAASLRLDSGTFDETAHLPAGISYWERGDFRLNPEHPPLSKLWAALPVQWLHRGLTDYDSSAWRGRDVEGSSLRSKASQWSFGSAVLHGRQSQSSHGPNQGVAPMGLLVPARLAMVLLGGLVGLVVYRWSREVWGANAALLSLALFAVSPTMLAHSRLVTTDMPVALGFVSTLWAAWRFCRAPGWRRGIVLALFFTVAQLLKFSSLILVPILAVSGLAWVGAALPRGDRRELLRRARWLGVLAGLLPLTAILGIWAGYGFRFRAVADPGYMLDWDVIGPAWPWATAWIDGILAARGLPEGYLYGLSYFIGGAQQRLAYLNGVESVTGFAHYFPVAFLLKTPPATFMFIGAAVLEVWRRRMRPSLTGWFLLWPTAFYLVLSMVGHLNIGHRHLAPLYPLLFVALGVLAAPQVWSMARRVALGSCLVLYFSSFVAATPDYLSYFNILAGGPRGGPRYLLDSNIDWGQDLIRLRRWMERAGLSQIHLLYFGTAEPEAYGIQALDAFDDHDRNPLTSPRPPASGAHLAVSVNMLFGLYMERDKTLAEALVRAGAVAPDTVQDWLDLRDLALAAGGSYPPMVDWLIQDGGVDESRLREIEAELPPAYIEKLRRTARPVGYAGHSIWIYRVP